MTGRRRGSLFSCVHVLSDDFHRPCELLGWMELDELAAGEERGSVPGRRVVRVARLVGLGMAVCVGELHLPFEYVAPVRALAAIVGETGEEGRQVDISRVLLETDRVAALPVLEVPLVALDLDCLRGSRF